MRFAERLLAFVNPKFESEDEMRNTMAVIIDFASKCELTADEFMLGMELAADGQLIYEDGDGFQKVKLFQEINRIKLGEVKAGYIFYRNQDKQYENSKNTVSGYLNPPKPEPTPEEKLQSFLRMCETQYERLMQKGSVMATTEFYKIIRKDVETVKLSWLERILDAYKPETFEGGILGRPAGRMLDLPKKTRHDAKLYLIDNIVRAYFEKEKLNQCSKEDFIDHWKKMYLK